MSFVFLLWNVHYYLRDRRFQFRFRLVHIWMIAGFGPFLNLVQFAPSFFFFFFLMTLPNWCYDNFFVCIEFISLCYRQLNKSWRWTLHELLTECLNVIVPHFVYTFNAKISCICSIGIDDSKSFCRNKSSNKSVLEQGPWCKRLVVIIQSTRTVFWRQVGTRNRLMPDRRKNLRVENRGPILQL